MSSVLIYQHEFFDAFVHRDEGVLRYVRNKARSDGEKLMAGWIELFSNLTLDSASLGILLDVRLAPGRNDRKFEDNVTFAFAAHLNSFARVVTLVKSSAGLLHVQRVASNTNVNNFVTLDETEAWRRVCGKTN